MDRAYTCRFCKTLESVTWNSRMFSWWCAACGRFDARYKTSHRDGGTIGKSDESPRTEVLDGN